MPLTISNPMLLAAVFGLMLELPAAGQKYTPPPPPLVAEPCKPTKKKPCPPPEVAPAATAPAANPFPFPGEAPEDATKPPVGSAAPLPGAPAQSAFPFPGEPAAELPSNSSSSSSSSSSSDPASDPDQPALTDGGSSGSTRFARKKLQKVAIVDPDERGAKDIEVSRYYFSTGNFQAAYLRAKDATTTIPDDPGAHLALADAALRTSKPEEAAAEYNACLKLDPSDEQIKAAKKSLSEIASAKALKRAAK